MRTDSDATGSRLVLAMPVGFRLTDNSGLAEACMIRTSVPQLLGRESPALQCSLSGSNPAAPAPQPRPADASLHMAKARSCKSPTGAPLLAGSGPGSSNGFRML